ncbi:glycosyltransferase family 2 protein [Dissulfurimicrobium hydrothermale]|uniref:glycosyltransferase family 2 protein n=1 Tax=Dissulfurimicrobium hydrothermale TaxID=1750598 RepID=UPI001EDB13CD|nr:glycosyltransferase family 2 protein [Dissulfurimicrobium hydrothermale]UKL13848.1 glycosyltransferase family 2 protein [Dissulfurimicrobium hydrothermale]
MENKNNPKIAVVIPCYNEEKNIEACYNSLVNILNQTNCKYDLIFVNDGSKDNTLEKLINLHKSDSNVKIIDFSRNFGKEIALSAGLDYVDADTDAVIPFDADLQHPPEVILQMLEKYKEGYDIVNAVRSKRDGETFLKKITSKLFYKIINKLTDIEIPKDVGDFRLISRDALEAIKGIRERKRFMKGIFAWVGFKTASVYYERAPRHSGKTKWNYIKLIDLAIEGITSFSAAPLRLASLLGLLVSFVAFLYAVWIIIAKLAFGNPVKGYPSMMVAILFLGGVQLITIGIIGEYIGRIYEEVKQRPLYIVKKVYDRSGSE